jgi:hypothetical protein
MNYDKMGRSDGANTARPAYQRGLVAPWPKGVSGNPSGRPPKSLYQQEMEKRFNDPETVRQMVDASVATMCDKKLGVAGVLERRNNQERIDGIPVQQVELNVNMSLAETMEQRRQRLLQDAS